MPPAQGTPPGPGWKSSCDIRDTLPADDPHRD
jgi:hypothetical protein